MSPLVSSGSDSFTSVQHRVGNSARHDVHTLLYRQLPIIGIRRCERYMEVVNSDVDPNHEALPADGADQELAARILHARIYADRGYIGLTMSILAV